MGTARTRHLDGDAAQRLVEVLQELRHLRNGTTRETGEREDGEERGKTGGGQGRREGRTGEGKR